MKTGTIALLLSCALALQFNVCYSQGSGKLLATPYPGSVREPKGQDGVGKYYSKDPVEKVKAHYEKTLGSFEAQEDNQFYKELMPSNQVWAILEKRGVVLGEASEIGRLGVMLHGKIKNYNYKVNEVMEELKKAYLLRFQGDENLDLTALANHLEEPELKNTLAKYENARWSYFLEGKDQAIYDKHYTEPGKNKAEELDKLTKKMTELTMNMEYEEAAKIGDKMMELQGEHSDAKYNWDKAIKCLDEFKQNAFATMIVIDTHPSSWDISGMK